MSTKVKTSKVFLLYFFQRYSILFGVLFFMLYKIHPERIPLHILSIPFIYSVIIPAVLLDIVVEIYHRICFPLYGLPYVKRSAYIRIDRQKLSYLMWFEKLNCMYCGYANGLFLYVAKIAQETEGYWCSIKHKEGGGFAPPPHQKDFFEYGDDAAYRSLEHKRVQEKQIRKEKKG